MEEAANISRGLPSEGAGFGANITRKHQQAFENHRTATDLAVSRPCGSVVSPQAEAYWRTISGNAVKRAKYHEDANRRLEDRATLAHYALRVHGPSLTFEDHVPTMLSTTLNAALRTVDSGIGMLFFRSMTMYLCVAILFNLLFVTFPEVGYYISALGVNDAVSLMILIVGIVVQKIIIGALWSFTSEPRSLHHSFETLQTLTERVSLITLRTAHEIADGESTSATRAELDHHFEVYVSLMDNIGAIGDRLMALYCSFVYGPPLAQSYLKQQRVAIETLLLKSNHARRETLDYVSETIRTLGRQERSDSHFYRLFHYASVLMTHFETVLTVYLFLVVPIQIYSAVSHLVMAVYPIMMYFLHLLRKEEDLLESSFALNTGVSQRTRYTMWTADFNRIRTACVRATLAWKYTPAA